MKINYEQQTPEQALELYCDWIVEHLKKFAPPFEWYFLFYPIRTLLLGDGETVPATLIQPTGETALTLTLPGLSREERDIILSGCLINYYAR